MTAVPDPRFRDQLAQAYETVRLAISDPGSVTPRVSFRRGEYETVTDWQTRAVLDAIAAEVEARVQAADNQRVVEELEEMADSIPCSGSEHEAKAMLRNRAAALAPAVSEEGA